MPGFRITTSIDYSFVMQTFDIWSTKETGKERADISWDARNDALSYEQLCYHDNQDFLKNVKSNVGSLTTFILSIIQ